jgi:CPA2 family monovalent cation:H+ antiporter-2
VLAFRYPLNTALTVAASLAQIGEFSFILAGLGQALGLMSVEAMNYVLAGALFSIALNPLMFSVIDLLRRWALNNSAFARELEQRGDPYAELPMTTERKYLEKQVVLVGYGRVGQRIAEALSNREIPSSWPNRIASWSSACANAASSVSGDAADPRC